MKYLLSVAFLLVSIQAQGNFLSAWKNDYLAACAMEKKDFKRAQDIYTEQLDQNPYDVTVNYNLGLAMYHQKKSQDALAYFQRAAQYAGDDNALREQALYNKGNALVDLKKSDEAIDAYRNVLDICSDNKKAQKAIEFLQQKKQEQEKKSDQNNDKQQDCGDKNSSQDQKNDDTNSQREEKDNAGERSQHKKQQQSQKHNDSAQKDLAQKKDEACEQSDDKRSDHKKSNQSNKKNDKQAGENQLFDSSSKSDNKDDDSMMPDLSDELKDRVDGKPGDDTRLDKQGGYIIQELADNEDQILKQLLKMNTNKGATHYGQKNW